jgi:hypothetical protein
VPRYGAFRGALRLSFRGSPITWSEMHMSKGQDRKKETKKKPAKTLDEKRAAKRAKKEGRGFSV